MSKQNQQVGDCNGTLPTPPRQPQPQSANHDQRENRSIVGH